MGRKAKNSRRTPRAAPPGRSPSSLLDTHPAFSTVYRGDYVEQLAKLPDRCIDLIRGSIDPAPVSEVVPPFNSSRNYEVF